MTLAPINVVTVRCLGYPGHPCGRIVTGINRQKRCPTCARHVQRLQVAEWKAAHKGERPQPAGDYDINALWVMVDAPDREYWGVKTAFRRGEINAMLRSIDPETGERALLDGTIFAREGDPDEMRIVKGGKMRVYIAPKVTKS